MATCSIISIMKTLHTLLYILFFSCFTAHAEQSDSVLFKVTYYTTFKSFIERTDLHVDELVLEVGEQQTRFYSLYRKMRKERMDSLKALGVDAFAIQGMIGDIPRNYYNYMIYNNYPENGKRHVECKHYHGLFYEEDMDIPQWEIVEGDSTILGYKCQKAVGTYRGHYWQVWFTPDIPVSYGPWKLSGLPGLILHAYDAKAFCTYDAIAFENGKGETLYTPKTKAQRSTREQDLKLVKLSSANSVAYFKYFGLQTFDTYTDRNGIVKKMPTHTAILLEDE